MNIIELLRENTTLSLKSYQSEERSDVLTHPIFLRPQEDSDVNIGQAIADLKDKMNATVMAHYYQDIEVQDVADFIGIDEDDSLPKAPIMSNKKKFQDQQNKFKEIKGPMSNKKKFELLNKN